MAGYIDDKDYFENEVQPPHIDSKQIIYEGGNVSDERKRELLSNAYVLLHLINYDETFGLGLIEALASGTPTIAVNRGSMPELIIDGETGFLVNNVDQAVEAVSRMDSISRKRCREIAEERFSVDRMVEDYIKVYKTILKNHNRESERSWGGYYNVLLNKTEYKVKVISVLPQGEISLQFHHHRSEHWFIVKGKGIVTKNGSKIRVLSGDSVDIPVNEVRHIENIGNDNLIFIEITQGDYLGEGDIVRLEDKYGRA